LEIKQGEYVNWSWSAPIGINIINYKIQQVDGPSSTNFNGGFDSGDASSSGSFLYQFNIPGIFYYWSTFVDGNQISLRGIIEVKSALIDKDLSISLTLNGISGNL
jgi:hypothetical protein